MPPPHGADFIVPFGSLDRGLFSAAAWKRGTDSGIAVLWILCALAVVVAAWRFGVGPALAAALVCPPAALAASYVLDSMPVESLGTQIVSLVVYVATCAAVIAMRISFDCAQRRAIESEQLKRAVRIEVLRQISSGLAHELRNPLGVVRNAAYLLRRRLSKSDVKPDLLDMIDEEIRSADATLSGLSEAIRARDPECNSVDLRAVARDALDRLAARSSIQGEMQFAPELSSVWCDARQLQQVFDALLQNAGEAMPGGGRVEIVGRRLNDFYVVEIRDSGPGIPPELVGEAFEPLVTTKRGRTGLGLPRCRQILIRHGGQIEAIGRPEGGTTIRLTLPARSASHVAAEPGSPSDAAKPAPHLPAEKLAL